MLEGPRELPGFTLSRGVEREGFGRPDVADGWASLPDVGVRGDLLALAGVLRRRDGSSPARRGKNDVRWMPDRQCVTDVKSYYHTVLGPRSGLHGRKLAAICPEIPHSPHGSLHPVIER